MWDVDIRVEEIPISDLDNNLDIMYLEKEGTNDWNLSPRMLVEDFEKEPTHAKRVGCVDLKYPIDIYLHKGEWIILDGVHRYTKALRNGDKTIKVRRISEKIAQQTKREN